ncbi:MAG: glycosyltransferase family 4 protein [Deltaproteobacteria bacterium]|nr:glycosyltransferase family 4 protein [Deltaproteobacteria bacterium]
MKVCIISPNAYPLLKGIPAERLTGGAELQMKTIGSAFARRGIDVHFLVDDFGQPAYEYSEGIHIHKVPFDISGQKIRFAFLILTLWRVLRRIGADIHIIKIPRNILMPLGIFCRKTGSKLIQVGQKDTDVDVVFLKKHAHWFNYISYRIGLKMADYIVAQNLRQKTGFRNMANCPVTVIRNAHSMQSSDSGKDDGSVLWVGNNQKDKRPWLVPGAAKALPGLRFNMIVADYAPGKHENYAADGTKNLTLRGYVPFEEIHEYFANAALLINTSLHEGFPNTFIQAWQHGTPVVSLTVDPDNVITEHGLGRVSGTFGQFLNDINDLMCNRDLRIAYGKNARSYVKKYHDLDNIVDQYMDIFRELSENRNRT